MARHCAPQSYTDEFQRLRARAGLRRIRLHGLRNTSVSLMLDLGHPPHIVAAWHGHDPAVALSIYADVKADELRNRGRVPVRLATGTSNSQDRPSNESRIVKHGIVTDAGQNCPRRARQQFACHPSVWFDRDESVEF